MSAGLSFQDSRDTVFLLVWDTFLDFEMWQPEIGRIQPSDSRSITRFGNLF